MQNEQSDKARAPVVLAAVAHPDDIEFAMAGTLLLLREAGWVVHYLNIANGCCGTTVHDYDTIVRLRTAEARTACAQLGAVFHEPLVDDLDIYYRPAEVARLTALVREVEPDVLLLHSPQDYMEDHTCAARLMVTAAFCRGMRNFASTPPRPPIQRPVAIYHAQPAGLRDSLGQPVLPEFYVDIGSVIDAKRDLLACHQTQQEWLDASQGSNAYLDALLERARETGNWSGVYQYAEGWRRHLPLGFGPADYDPLRRALAGRTSNEPRYGLRLD